MTNSDGTVDTHVRELDAQDNAGENRTLAVIKNYNVEKGKLPKFLIEFVPNRLLDDDAWFTIRLDSAFIEGSGEVNITSGTATGQQKLWNTSAVDYFLLDTGISNKAGADHLVKGDLSNGFDASNDKIVLAEDVEKVLAKVEGANTILYRKSVNDEQVLAVIEDFTGTFDVNDLVDTNIIVADIV